MRSSQSMRSGSAKISAVCSGAMVLKAARGLLHGGERLVQQ
jgi:hypothetical protein